MADQKIFFTQNRSESKVVKVFITDNKYERGVVKCTPVSSKSSANIIGYVVSSKHEAQLIICLDK